MENNYKYFAFKYTYEKLGLKEIEEELLAKGIQCLDFQNEESSLYRSISKFFVLKNNVDIKELTSEEQELFKQYFTLPVNDIVNNPSLLNEINSYIEKTLQRVLFPKIEENHLYYGPINMNYVAPRDSIVLGFEYYEFKIEENFDEAYVSQQRIICDALNNIQFNLAAKMGCQVSVIKYNEFYEKKTDILGKK